MAANGFGALQEERPRRVRRRRPLGREDWKWWLSRVAVLALAMLVISASVVITAPFPYTAPALEQTAFMYDREGRLITAIEPAEQRVVVPLGRIPERVRNAVIAAEDERFYDHPGVDLVAILRAAWKDVTGGRFQGGSTITQQLVKNLYVGSERTLWRKIREAATAIRLERSLSKHDILEQYLNYIYLGQGAYGVEAAARTYFDKHVWGLNLGEAATLAGLAAAPARYDPRVNPEAAVARRNWVLDRMASLGMITEHRGAAFKQEPLELAEPREAPSRAAYFVQYLTGQIKRRFGDDMLYRGGLRIETTLDLRLQRAAEQAIASTLDRPGDPEAALVAIDVRTGGILAMVGGRDFRRSEVNLATGQGGLGRQAGSAFKPFVLTTALEEGISQYAVYPAPGTTTVGDWTVSNYGGGSYGSMSLRSATVNSVNTVYAQLIMDVGPGDVVRRAHRMGIRSFLHADGPLTLGTSEVNPLEMTAGYATLASGGIYRPPTGIQRLETADGRVLQELHPRGRRAVSGGTTALVTDILQDAVAYGTGSGARIPGVAFAGKTGTAEDHADAWFCGYTTRVATCVWVGYPKARIPMSSVHGIAVSGGTFPAEIWRAFMTQVPGSGAFGASDAPPPSGSSSVAPPSSGPAPDDGAPAPSRDAPAREPPAEEPPPPEDDDGGIIPDLPFPG